MRKAPYPPCKLDPTQQRAWEDTLAALSWIAPGFVHILYTMLSNTSNKDTALFTHWLPAAGATDGYQLIFNPKLFFKYTLMERVFIVLHEEMHEIENHCRVSYTFKVAGKITVGSKSLPWDDDYSNRIQDYVINAVLIASKFGQFNKDWLFDITVATDADDWVTAYFRNWRNRQKLCPPKPKLGSGPPGQPGQPGQPGDAPPEVPAAPGPGQFDCHVDPHQSQGADPHEVPERSEAQWEIAVNTAMEIQKAQGKLPSAMAMWFNEILKPKVDWTEHIEGLVKRIAGSGAYDWRKLDRRLVTRRIGAPGVTGHTAGLVVIGMDSSGSIYQDPKLIDRWLGELSGIMEDVQPERCLVVWCDAKVQRVDELTDPSDIATVFHLGAKGGGGTSFRPVFDYIAEEGLEPDMLLYLTDGDGSFPDKAPDYPLIWGDITKNPKKYPFGAVVQVPNEANE